MPSIKPDIKLTDRQKAIIYGTLLGDGSFKGRSKKTRYFSVSHSSKQKDYIFWLYDELKNICPSAPRPYVSRDGKYITYTLITSPRRDFFQDQLKIYIPKKTVKEGWLDLLTPLSVSVWYMDDGSLNYKNKIRSYFSFASNSFSVDEHYLLKLFFEERYGIKTEIKQIRRNKKYQCNLIVSDESFDDFFKLIEKYIPQCMAYKLPGVLREEFLKKNIETKITKEKLKELYYVKKMTQQQIAEVYGVHRLTVSKYMNLFKLNPRSNKEAQLNGQNSNNFRGNNGRFYPRENTLSELEKANVIFRELRKTGFQYPLVSRDEAYISLIDSLFSKNCAKDKYGAFKYSSAGLKISSDFSPQIFHMASKGSFSPIEIFNDDNMLLDSIRRSIKYTRQKETVAMVRRGFKTYKSNRCVSNFPPLWSKAIIDEICEDNEGLKILDFSCGFGGRQIGSYISNKVEYYLGIDPLRDNIETNRKIYSLIINHSKLKDRKFEADFLMGRSEKIICELDEMFDMVLTSPPYFNKEIYSKSENQCYNLHPKYEDWRDSWFKDVLFQSYGLLSPRGVMAIFIGNVGKYQIIDDCREMMRNLSSSEPLVYEFLLPNIEYNRKKNIRNTDICLVIKKQ